MTYSSYLFVIQLFVSTNVLLISRSHIYNSVFHLYSPHLSCNSVVSFAFVCGAFSFFFRYYSYSDCFSFILRSIIIIVPIFYIYSVSLLRFILLFNYFSINSFIIFSILCLTRDFIRQGHAREKRKVYRATRTRSQAIDRG